MTARVSFVIRTDAHVCDKAPESRVDDYLETCLDKLTQIRDLASARQATAVLDNGDFFHNKTASRNSHLMLRRVIDLHQSYPCPVYENPGNHDFPYGNVDYIHQQPLGVLFAADVFKRMTDHTFEAEGDDGQTLKVRVVGFPYKVVFEVFEWDLERGDEDILIVCAHTFASPEGGQFFGKEKVQSYQELAECSPDVFIFGHWHQDQGIQEVRGKHFFNLGSMTRGSLTEDNLKRIPRIGWLEITKDAEGSVSIQTEAVALEVKEASEVFDLERRDRVLQERKDIDAFLDSLSASVDPTKVENVREAVESLDIFEEEVRTVALNYLTEVGELL